MKLNSRGRLLDFFMTGRNFDYTLTDLSKKAGISWTTLNRIFPKLNAARHKELTVKA